jgi:transposase
MIDQQMRKAIFWLHKEGMSLREISKRFKISRNTVDAIIKQSGIAPVIERKNRITIDYEALLHHYNECDGFVQRVHERLSEEGIKIAYPTLTRLVRKLGLGRAKDKRCYQMPDVPGEEVQHDTTVYNIKLGDVNNRLIASILYFRYSKMRYLKFYRSFRRFRMKCFFYEALTYFGYCASVCVIDNTNLARLRGAGKDAVIVPEMERFAKLFGFKFICHAIRHPNRKAGNERSFYTVETNFLPGRKFENLEDLNQQALSWSTVKMANRLVGKSALIPSVAFEYEKAHLIKLPPFIPQPYLIHQRYIDQYGYIAFDGNYYWIPGKMRNEVTVTQYSDCLKVYMDRNLLVEYKLPPEDIKNKTFFPEGKSRPVYLPKHRKRPTLQEEKQLRALDPEIDSFLNFILKEKGRERHRVVRELFNLSQKISLPLFIKTIKRASRYRIKDTEVIKRISLLQISANEIKLPCLEIDEELEKRENYREGRISDKVDLSIYDKMLEEKEEIDE